MELADVSFVQVYPTVSEMNTYALPLFHAKLSPC
jgi:hypothetical protein